MSRVLNAIEKGLRVYAENSQSSYVDLLFGSGPPAGISGETLAASIGSIYLDSTNGFLYQKKTSTDSASDWIVNDSLSASYLASSGNVSPSDTFETAISKLDGVNDNQDSLFGMIQGSSDFESFTGSSLADAQNAKQLFQRIEVLLEQIRGVQVAGVTTIATIDSVPHASVKSAKWIVEAYEDAAPANRQALEVFALNNGTIVDDTIYAKLKTGSDFNLTISVDISGADMRLRASSTTAGVTITARRIEVIKSVL